MIPLDNLFDHENKSILAKLEAESENLLSRMGNKNIGQNALDAIRTNKSFDEISKEKWDRVRPESPFGEGSVFAEKKEPGTYLLQISITKKPKDFGDTLSFEINTNLPNGERIDIYVYDSDSYFSDKPNVKNDTELYKKNYSLSTNKNVSIEFNAAMQKLAFKDFENGSAECYLKITNVKIKDAFSEVFSVNLGSNESSLDKLAKMPMYTPDWMKLQDDAAKTPIRKFTEEEINDLAATVIGESGSGRLILEQQMAIAWTYYNRLSSSTWINKSLDACLTGYSYAYKNATTKKPASDVMVVMTAFGNKKYANESSGVGSLTIQELVDLKNENTKFYQGYIEKGRLLKAEMSKQFASPWKNPYPGYTNQGYWRDLCGSVYFRSDLAKKEDRKGKLEDSISSKDLMWVQAMLYFYMQEEKKIPSDYSNTFVKKLRTEGDEYTLGSTSFIFKVPEITQFFNAPVDRMPKTYKEIPFYNYLTDTMYFLKK
jgi:hypothetical protein